MGWAGGAGGCGATTKLLAAAGVATASTGCGWTTGCLRTGTLGGGGGKGLAGVLVSAALTDAREAGKRIVAVCPYVAKYVKTHHDFDDILDPVTPAALAAVEARQG